ncbi:FAD-dependent oxidoreductase [Solwaraspora sp. WMMD406]|uniref:NAD(P)/FAD-dependent oxidoreductase n=1 Tax=Solwaraspora sp. WMMD406 TaxID=3016095 RepID=UPI002416B468|nr:FAD-dependent oxidoreductase [Solwaraspora sp. WMMD406]MDG4765867.1 FAD-dependent oxidoreductase [Solwaraspora sp. WMMD406]
MSRAVVVIGGGYGGSAVAKALDADADVVLVDPRDAFVNAAGSLRALTQPEWAPNMFFSFDTLLKRGRVIRDRAASVDPQGVTLASGERIDADYIVLATGSSYAYPAKPNDSSTLTVEALNDLRESHKELLNADRVLILGAGPVGLELGGEIKEVWPNKQVTIVDPAEQLLPGFLPEVREDLHRQLDGLGIEVRLGTGLTAQPSTPPGRAGTCTVTTTAGDEIVADIWFRAFGVRVNSECLADGKLVGRDGQGAVPVTEHLNVEGYAHVYALGDVTNLAEAKMAGYAMQHAEVVAKNIIAQLNGEQPSATYTPAPDPMILLPLGPRGGVGQLPMPETTPVGSDIVSQYKGADLFTGRFAEQFRAD